MTLAGERLRLARQNAGLEPETIAESIGISVPGYWDLETRDDLFTCISLRELARLAQLLGITTGSLFQEKSQEPVSIQKVSFPQLAEELRKATRERSLTFEALEDAVGWELKRFLEDPAAAWNWNVDCLKDVCRFVGRDWICALP